MRRVIDPDDEPTLVTGPETVRDIRDRWFADQADRAFDEAETTVVDVAIPEAVVDQSAAFVATPRVQTRVLGSRAKVVVIRGGAVRVELP